ncbi:pyridoxamine 5'-phosphate oxidase [Sodalis endosymbiont of Henestaris halophilus]|uniref:pyridoxamine 5'-phosphate oxidase n=1 Tax=Sodalis endosymbiont of Henestaris halophilus TaxID=1929246 RepID=UPI000BC0D78C|nr:pyridoxamine 5'-phosphate oxidase [Sodalis endosymbiont of Henestaris halophilus]SNC58781.1 Pyridoxine/pyridoxamine 5'-phosphate oxidase [Sodalis endosymbiont of Henestaris halophilus]
MIEHSINIADLRREYIRGGLRRADLTAEPMDLFGQWFKQVCTAHLPEATAMSVGTVDDNNQPYQRLVLLKHFDRQCMIFYTNLSSRKSSHLAHRPRISLHFPWHALERQVLVLGLAEKLSVMDVKKYFYSRPRDSQISAWVSHQSSRIYSRGFLEGKFMELKNKFAHGKVPLPSFWGGYRVIIDAMEFWQGREHRLHDRFLYQRINGGWKIERLAP